MTNKPMLSVERELRALAEKACGTAKDSPEYRRFLEAVSPTIVLDLTAEPAAQHQGEPVGYVCGHALDAMKNDRMGAEFIGMRKDSHGYQTTPLFAEQPAPVAAVMPGDWEDQLFAEMSLRFGLRKQIDDDHMVYDDTQIGVEFARDWIKARLNGVKP